MNKRLNKVHKKGIGEIHNEKLYINCNDCFWWGTADCEEVKEEDVSLLERCLREADYAWGDLLFVSKKRKLRIQGAMFDGLPKKLINLFLSCGEERAIDIANPYNTKGEYLYYE